MSSFANLGVGVAIAFFFGWKLSLVALGFIPFMVVGSFLQVCFMQGYSSQDNKALERAGSVCDFVFSFEHFLEQLVFS